MIWSEEDVCENLFGYILVIFVVTYLHFLILFHIFYGLVCTFDSMISNDQRLFTFF